MYGDRKPLFANSVLPLFAIALADNASQDYLIIEEIEAIPMFAVERLKNMKCYRIKYSLRNSFFFLIVQGVQHADTRISSVEPHLS